MRKNILAMATIGMLLLSSFMIVPTVIGDSYSGTVYYVGGTGLGNYTNIQDAIDAASNGDTVFVYNGTYCENVIVDKSINLIGEDRDITIIDGEGSGDVVRIEADVVNVSGFTMANTSLPGSGILINSKYNKISYNKIIDTNYMGIQCHFDNNSFMDNYFISNHLGFLLGSSNNTLIGNNFENDGIFIESGSYQNTIEDNVVNGKPLVYLEGETGVEINDAGQIILVDCENVAINDVDISSTFVGMELITTVNSEIKYNNINDCIAGIFLDMSSHNDIYDNDLGSNLVGMALSNSENNIMKKNYVHNSSSYGDYDSMGLYLTYSSNNNTIAENIVAGIEDYGISITYDSRDNLVHHNNFIENDQNAKDECNNQWDDGSEGNYWDDYSGEDNDSDGIGDSPYNISGGDNQDRYPLIEPWAEPTEDTTPPVIHSIVPEKALYINNEKKSRTRLVRMALIVGDITIEVNATDNESGIKQVNFTIDPFRPFAKQEGNDTTAPYTYNWSKKAVFRFAHVHLIKVEVIDNAGNIAKKTMIVRRIL